MKTYEVIIPEKLWGRELSRFYRAKSAGAAKYQYWLDFSDCYPDWKFGDFLRVAGCRVTK